MQAYPPPPTATIPLVSREVPTTPRGRHAPPLEVRQDLQRRRLFGAAATVFARVGYADATAEAIAREAGMSKATFYEHFDNKEDCIVALFDAGVGVLTEAMTTAGEARVSPDPSTRVHATVQAFLQVLADFPAQSQTLLVEIVGAGPRAMERRDAALDRIAATIDGFHRADAERGLARRFASSHDAFAIVGAVVELASRHLRTGRPADIRELEPVIERIALGLVEPGPA
jgi:AcrR family transcriptional regulator